MPGTVEKFKKLCKSKEIQVHFKGTNTLRTLSIVHKRVNNQFRTIKEAMLIHIQDTTLNRNMGKYQLPHIWDHLLLTSPTL